MIRKEKQLLCSGIVWLALFAVWTLLIRTVDIQPAGPSGTDIGFASLNIWFHKLTGVHLEIYTVTDWLGLVPVCVCMLFAGIGVWQLIRRKHLKHVDFDILLLGIYYSIVVLCYLVFEMVPINYRPILIDGRLEASYPSSTTLLVLAVMPTLTFQIQHRFKQHSFRQLLCLCTILFSFCMVAGRLISGVHWFTDIVGSILLSRGLFSLYKAAVLIYYKEEA